MQAETDVPWHPCICCLCDGWWGQTLPHPQSFHLPWLEWQRNITFRLEGLCDGNRGEENAIFCINLTDIIHIKQTSYTTSMKLCRSTDMLSPKTTSNVLAHQFHREHVCSTPFVSNIIFQSEVCEILVYLLILSDSKITSNPISNPTPDTHTHILKKLYYKYEAKSYYRPAFS